MITLSKDFFHPIAEKTLVIGYQAGFDHSLLLWSLTVQLA
jgi:hypothetical protein